MGLAAVQNTFDSWARLYNLTHGWLPGRRAARLWLDLQPGDRVLDLACGTGLNFRHLRQLVGDRGRVVGLDLSPRMLEIGRALIAAQAWTNVTTRQGDAAALPFPPESFDAAICSFALNIIPDFHRALQEVRRVLIPGGRFVSLEIRSGVHSRGRLWRACAVDMSHDARTAIKETFGDVRVRRRWAGMVSIARAVKPREA